MVKVVKKENKKTIEKMADTGATAGTVVGAICGMIFLYLCVKYFIWPWYKNTPSDPIGNFFLYQALGTLCKGCLALCGLSG